MPSREELLQRKTYNDVEEGEIGRRVYYTVHGEQKERNTEIVIHRLTKVVSQLTQILIEKKLITPGQLDELLLEAAMS
jgi:hypothetical protein